MIKNKSKRVRLIFEDGKVFKGRLFTTSENSSGEVVFNTSMSGYQEILTDPSYCGQMVLMTYPLIGNTGINLEDVESRGLFLSALLMKEYIDFPSNYRSTKSLKDYLDENGISGAEGFDTRAITRYLRDEGAKKALLTTSTDSVENLVETVKGLPSMAGQNLAQQVSSEASYHYPAITDIKFKVAVIDCGVKTNILRQLVFHGCDCTVFPYDVDSSIILEGGFDGLFLSNGPGDPSVVTKTIQTIQDILGKLPIFGICLGHQLLALALGGKTYKLEFGHHGANHPVQQLSTTKVEITSQNHGFCVDINSFSDDVEVTHINLNDNTVEGFRHKTLPAFSVQYHPESAPGPHDSQYLFEEFSELMETTNVKKGASV